MKIKTISRFLAKVLLLINAVLVLLMIACAYSQYLNPTEHPYMSCAGLAFAVFFFINIACVIFWLIIKWKYAFLSIFALLVCLSQCRDYLPINFTNQKAPEGSLKILSYNVMSFDAKPHTPENPNDIIVYLQNCDADIICLQEFTEYGLSINDTYKALSKYPYKHHYFVAYGLGGLGCFSRYPILSAKVIPYPSAANASIAYQIKIKNDTVLVVNNHLESNNLNSEDKKQYKEIFTKRAKGQVKATSKLLIKKLANSAEIRSEQARMVHEYIQNSKEKTIIACGDFNDTPLSYAHRTIENGLTDAYTESGNGIGMSYNRSGFYFRIDNIMISKDLESYNCTVDRSIKTSDHYPIWCYIHKKDE